MKPRKNDAPTEDWEYDFTNPPRIQPPQEGDMDNPFKSFFHLAPKTKRASYRNECCVCGQTVINGFEIPVTKTVGCSTIQDFVCSKACEQTWNTKQIRLGL